MEIENFKEWADNILSTKENCEKFLIELGINNTDGSLTENYK